MTPTHDALTTRGLLNSAAAIDGITLELRSDTRFHTAYHADGRPAATIQQRRVYDYVSPRVSVYATDGTLLFTSSFLLPRDLCRRIAHHLALRHAATHAAPLFEPNTYASLTAAVSLRHANEESPRT